MDAELEPLFADHLAVVATRTVEALSAWTSPVIGIEPSSLTTLRDEFLALLPGEATRALAARAFLLSEFLDREKATLPLRELPGEAHIHGHCGAGEINRHPPAGWRFCENHPPEVWAKAVLA